MPAAQSLELSIRGLHTYNSALSGVPKGALRACLNMDIKQLNLGKPRRGFNVLSHDLLTVTDRAQKLFEYKDSLWAHTGTELQYSDGSSFASRGTISAPSGQKLRKAIGNQNLYLVTSNGIYKTDSVSNSVSAAGVPKAIHLTATANGVSGFLANTNAVGYRYRFGRYDANSNLVLGGASMRKVFVSATAPSTNVDLVCYLPSGIAAGDFIQLYRTTIFTGATLVDEEYQLCFERTVTAADITAGSITITDIIEDGLLGAILDVSSSQGGIAENNENLPFAKDLTVYKNFLFAANLRYRQRLQVTLLATASSGTSAYSLKDNDTITFTRGATVITYTAKAAPTLPTHFQLTTGVSTSSDIQETALALVDRINRDTTQFVYAYYISGSNDLPGKILLEARDLTNTAFTVTSAARPSAFQPTLISPATSLNTSSGSEYKNGLGFSKQGQSEHMPLKNIFFVGRPDKDIIRIAALRDCLMILKQDGTWVLRGEDEFSFTIQEVDTSAILLAPECLAIGNNLVYCLLTTGFAQISDTDVKIISIPIKDQLDPILGTASAQLTAYAHAEAYDSDGKVLFWIPQSSADTSATVAFFYNYNNDTFGLWDIPSDAATIFQGKIHAGFTSSAKIRVERKALNYTDYVDYGSSMSITLDAGLTLTVTDASDIAKGDVLQQGSLFAYVESVNIAANLVTLDLDVAWDTGSPITHLKGIEVEIGWNPQFADNPAGYKMWQECLLIFNRGFLKDATIEFFTDVYTGVSSVEITQTAGTGAFGDFDFGDATFGGDPAKRPVRVLVPRNAARSSLLFVTFKQRVAYSDFEINGLSLTFRPISTRVA